MKKNGFTLVELIGVVAIIALVMVVAVPSVMSTLTNSTVKESETFKHDLEMAAESYIENNWSSIKSEFEGPTAKKINMAGLDRYCISLKTLMNNNYIKPTDKDPETKDNINVEGKYILLTDENASSDLYKFTFNYVDITKSTDELAPICQKWKEQYEKNN